MTDATIIPIRTASTPGYTDSAALNDLHFLLTTTSDTSSELHKDITAIVTRTGRAMIPVRDIEVTTAETTFGRPLAMIRSAGTVITIRQQPAGPGLLITIAPASTDEGRITVTLAGTTLTHPTNLNGP